MTFTIPSGLGFVAILLIAFVAGFAWTAGVYVFGRIVSRTARP